MRGLYDQIVEQLRDKTQPPFRCRSCGSEEFKEWEPIWYSNWVTVLGYDETTGFDLDYDCGQMGDGGDFPREYWCAKCEDSAKSLEELVGLPRPDWVTELTDREALDAMHRILSLPEWQVGMLEDIGDLLYKAGYREAHPDPHWDRH